MLFAQTTTTVPTTAATTTALTTTTTGGAGVAGTTPDISNWEAILWIVVGIIASFLVPVAISILLEAKRRYAPSSPFEAKESKDKGPSLLKAAWNRYGRHIVFALGVVVAAGMLAAALVFIVGMKFDHWRQALVAGFAWQSLLEKLTGQMSPPANPPV
jgi:hypothetical protein